MKLVDAGIRRHVANEQQMLSALSEREQQQLDRLLRKLLGHLAAGAGP